MWDKIISGNPNNNNNNKGIILLVVIGLFLIRGALNIGASKEPVKDVMATLINNSVSAEYYYNIKAEKLNEEYGHFAHYGWDEFVILKDLPGSEKSDNMVSGREYWYADYGTFEKHRTRFFQNRTDAEMTEDVFCMNICQKWEKSEQREPLYITENGTEYRIELLDFYNKDTGEFIKTVSFIWWHKNGSSFFIESDYSFEELLPYIEDMDVIKVEKQETAKAETEQDYKSGYRLIRSVLRLMT